MIGVHAPGYSFGRDREAVERAVERLGAPLPRGAGPRPRRSGGCTATAAGPGRYLFDRRSLLRFLHYGEGEYLETELAIQEALAEMDADLGAPRRRSSRCDPRTRPACCSSRRRRTSCCRPTAAGWSWCATGTTGEDWIEAADAGAAASFSFSAGGAFAVLSGGDVEPGLYETDGTVTAEEPGLRLHAVQFTPAPPAPSGSPGGA